MVRTVTGSNTDTLTVLNGLGLDERYTLFDANSGNATWNVVTDVQGSTVQLNGTSPSPVGYSYPPFGGLGNPTAVSPNPFRYTGREASANTGLLFFRGRYYNPAWGRFVSEDPLGIAAGPNLYAYVGNDPINFGDPTGNQGLGGAFIGAAGGATGGYISGGVRGAALGAAVGGIVGLISGPAGDAAGVAAGRYFASTIANGAVNAATTTLFNAGGGAAGAYVSNITVAPAGTNPWSGIWQGAVAGAASPLLSGETMVVGFAATSVPNDSKYSKQFFGFQFLAFRRFR